MKRYFKKQESSGKNSKRNIQTSDQRVVQEYMRPVHKFKLNMQTHRDLVEMIRSAWKGATPPDSGNISMPTYDDEGVSEYFSGKTWEGHTARQLRILDFAPNVFTDEAFAYYLPAYLIADIEDPEESDTNVERVLYWLSQESKRSSENRGLRVIVRLSELQRSALREYIAFIQEKEQGLYNEECATIVRFLNDVDGHV